MADEPTFQSSPVTKDGRYVIPGSFCDLIDSFNPRPSLRTGATAATCAICFNPRPSLKDVSILARH
jgi:hypothetical protein